MPELTKLVQLFHDFALFKWLGSDTLVFGRREDVKVISKFTYELGVNFRW